MPPQVKDDRIAGYVGPWQGLDVSAPETEIASQASPYLKNVYLRSGELRSFPKFKKYMDMPVGATVGRALNSFKNDFNLYNTLLTTPEGLYALNVDNTWTQLFTFPNDHDNGIPYANAVFKNKFYFAKPLVGEGLREWTPTINNVSTVCSFAAPKYLAELDAHLLMAYTYETGDPSGLSVFPWRVRWSASGLTQFDPTVNIGAGLNDLIDVCDELLGIYPMGRSAYLFRSNGISEIYPIGGYNPFGFNHLWSAQRGIGGSIYPYGIASYGSLIIFISWEQIYIMTSGNFKAIGSKIRNKIYDDLKLENYHPVFGGGSAETVPQVISCIVPKFKDGHVYPVYQLWIPQGDYYNGTAPHKIKLWQYSIHDDNWTNATFEPSAADVVSGDFLDCPGTTVWVMV